MNICSKCHTTKPLEDFYSSISICKSCYKNYYRTYATKLKHVYADMKKQGVKYSLDEFLQKYRNDPVYLDLFRKWEADDFQRRTTPTFFRRDASEQFGFNNLVLAPWVEAKKSLRKAT